MVYALLHIIAYHYTRRPMSYFVLFLRTLYRTAPYAFLETFHRIPYYHRWIWIVAVGSKWVLFQISLIEHRLLSPSLLSPSPSLSSTSLPVQ